MSAGPKVHPETRATPALPRSLDNPPLICYQPREIASDQVSAQTSGPPDAIDNNALQESTVQVLVRDNNVDQALRVLKKKMQREGIFREMKMRDHFEKPSEKRAREKGEAVRRARKLARKKLQREGLLPAPVKPKRP